jgi:hypothetical protein
VLELLDAVALTTGDDPRHIDKLRAQAHQTIKAALLTDSSLSAVLRRFETASATIDNTRKQRKTAMRRVDAGRLVVD